MSKGLPSKKDWQTTGKHINRAVRGAYDFSKKSRKRLGEGLKSAGTQINANLTPSGMITGATSAALLATFLGSGGAIALASAVAAGAVAGRVHRAVITKDEDNEEKPEIIFKTQAGESLEIKGLDKLTEQIQKLVESNKTLVAENLALKEEQEKKDAERKVREVNILKVIEDINKQAEERYQAMQEENEKKHKELLNTITSLSQTNDQSKEFVGSNGISRLNQSLEKFKNTYVTRTSDLEKIDKKEEVPSRGNLDKSYKMLEKLNSELIQDFANMTNVFQKGLNLMGDKNNPGDHNQFVDINKKIVKPLISDYLDLTEKSLEKCTELDTKYMKKLEDKENELIVETNAIINGGEELDNIDIEYVKNFDQKIKEHKALLDNQVNTLIPLNTKLNILLQLFEGDKKTQAKIRGVMVIIQERFSKNRQDKNKLNEISRLLDQVKEKISDKAVADTQTDSNQITSEANIVQDETQPPLPAGNSKIEKPSKWKQIGNRFKDRVFGNKGQSPDKGGDGKENMTKEENVLKDIKTKYIENRSKDAQKLKDKYDTLIQLLRPTYPEFQSGENYSYNGPRRALTSMEMKINDLITNIHRLENLYNGEPISDMSGNEITIDDNNRAYYTPKALRKSLNGDLANLKEKSQTLENALETLTDTELKQKAISLLEEISSMSLKISNSVFNSVFPHK